MDLDSRRDEFCFFLGFVSRSKTKQLAEAIADLSRANSEEITPETVFDVCPYNDQQAQILRTYAIFESGKSAEITRRITELLEEYIFLFSDFVPPCCEDGRTFYALTSTEEIVLVCDRCGTLYSLDERPMNKTKFKKMKKSDFLMIFGDQTEGDWPFHTKIYELHRSRIATS